MTTRYLVGDVFDRMSELEDGSVDLILTSPPFLALRSYLPDGDPNKGKEIGSEPTPADYLDVLLRWTAECRRVLAPHGSLCVELGDTYAGSGGAGGDYGPDGMRDGQQRFGGSARRRNHPRYRGYSGNTSGHNTEASDAEWSSDLKPSGPGWPLPKSLVGVPQLYMLSLAYGRNILTGQPSPAGMWRVRNVKPWIRTNPPVGALGDKERPATSYVIVACTSANRWFDLDAVRTAFVYPDDATRPRTGHAEIGRVTSNIGNNSLGAPPRDWWHQVDAIIDAEIDRRAGRPNGSGGQGGSGTTADFAGRVGRRFDEGTDNVTVGARGVHIRRALEQAGILTTLEALDISPKGYAGAHYAVWPPELCRQLIDEMCPPGGTVLDPFVGSGTTLSVASGMARDSIGIDIDPRNADLARERVGMFLEIEEREAAP